MTTTLSGPQVPKGAAHRETLDRAGTPPDRSTYYILDSGFDSRGRSLSTVWLGDRPVLHEVRPWEAREFVRLMAMTAGREITELDMERL